MKEFGVELVGPTRSGGRHQGEGFKLSNFVIDWKQQEALCPAGRTSSSWTPAVDRGKDKVVKIKFSCSDCGNCRFQPSAHALIHRAAHSQFA